MLQFTTIRKIENHTAKEWGERGKWGRKGENRRYRRQRGRYELVFLPPSFAAEKYTLQNLRNTLYRIGLGGCRGLSTRGTRRTKSGPEGPPTRGRGPELYMSPYRVASYPTVCCVMLCWSPCWIFKLTKIQSAVQCPVPVPLVLFCTRVPGDGAVLVSFVGPASINI